MSHHDDYDFGTENHEVSWTWVFGMLLVVSLLANYKLYDEWQKEKEEKIHQADLFNEIYMNRERIIMGGHLHN